MKYDVIIIGGGASGLCTAIKAKKNNNSVLVLEHSDRAAKKILQTGNGRCNLTNKFCRSDLLDVNPEGVFPFNSSGSEDFIRQVIRQFDCDDTIRFFRELGVLTCDRNGYIYPRSEQAASVNDILRYACDSCGVDIMCGYNTERIVPVPNGEGFEIDGRFLCRFLVIAAGGMSAPATGSDGSGYSFARSLGHTVIKPVPALCGLKCSDRFTKALAGVRNDSCVTLLDSDHNVICRVFGNLQFTSYGISGIPVFQISSAASRMLAEGKHPLISIDLLPEFSSEKLTDFLDHDYPKSDRLSGILNRKLAAVIEKECQKDPHKHAGESYGTRTVPVIKRFKMHPVSSNSFEDAQTTAGGISTDEIDPHSMMSRKMKGLYFTGEIMDVDGICGGYNLQWAWSTAHIAAKDIISRLDR